MLATYTDILDTAYAFTNAIVYFVQTIVTVSVLMNQHLTDKWKRILWLNLSYSQSCPTFSISNLSLMRKPFRSSYLSNASFSSLKHEM